MMLIISLTNVLMTLFYLIPGFILAKCHKGKKEHLPILGAILVYIGTPFLQVSSFLSLGDFNITTFTNLWLCILLSMIAQVLFATIIYLIVRNKYEDAKYRIMTVGSIVGNTGFFGLPIIRALFPNNPEVAVYSMAFCVTMNIIVFTLGVYCLTGDKKYISLKPAIINPTNFGFLIGLLCYIFNLHNYLPEVLVNGIGLVGSMTTPLCMIVLGVRLANIPIKQLFINKQVYITSILKMFVFPLFAYLLVFFLPIDSTLKGSIFILSATPCAAILLSMAEIHQKETDMSANCILFCTLFCFISIPLLSLLVQFL